VARAGAQAAAEVRVDLAVDSAAGDAVAALPVVDAAVQAADAVPLSQRTAEVNSAIASIADGVSNGGSAQTIISAIRL